MRTAALRRVGWWRTWRASSSSSMRRRSSSSWRSEPMGMGVLGMVASGVGSWSVGGRIIANVGLIYKLAVVWTW